MEKRKAPLDLEAVRNEWAKGGPQIVQIECLEDFIRLATWLYSAEDVIFRGQRCDWPLVPAVGRVSERAKWMLAEQNVIAEFKREALPYLLFMPSNDWQWLAVAQHNRLPTRLLDWTRNPLVALWFAVSEPAGGNEPGIVWAHYYGPSDAIYATTNLASPFSIDRTFVYFPEHVFPFIQAQSGVFTIHHRRAEGETFVPFEEADRSNLTKIEISADSFSTIRHQLFRLGVNPASLFPGLSGLVDRIKYHHELLADEKET